MATSNSVFQPRTYSNKVPILRGASYIDIVTTISASAWDLLPDLDSVRYSSFVNLFNCPIGDRGRIFQPRYGSNLIMLLQEPIDYTTAMRIKGALFRAVERWDPRVRILPALSYVIEDESLPGYWGRLVVQDNIHNTGRTAQFDYRFIKES